MNSLLNFLGVNLRSGLSDLVNYYLVLKGLFTLVFTTMRFRVSLIFFFTTIVVGLNLLTPWVFKTAISKLYSEELVSNIFLVLFSYGAIWTISKIIFQFSELLCMRILERGNSNFCVQIFDKIFSNPWVMFSENSVGGIMHSLEAAQKSIYIIIYGILLNALSMFLELILLSFIIFFNYGILYAMVLFLFPVIYLFYSVIALVYLSKMQEQSRLKNKKAASLMNDILVNIPNIYFQRAEMEVINKLKVTLKNRENTAIRAFEGLSKVGIGQSIISGCGLTTITTLVGLKVVKGDLHPSDFVLITGYFIQFIAPLSSLSITFREIYLGLNKLDKISQIVLGDQKNLEEKISQTKIQHYDISFMNVYLKYPQGASYAAMDLSFHILKGESVAIVGENGAGKSTIIRLISKMYSPTIGKIFLGNQDLTQMHPKSVMSVVAIVPQETLLLDDSIYNNIMLGNHDSLNKEDFQIFAEKIGINDFVQSLPDGYNTLVGEYGIRLSGGQRKLVGVARALLRRTQILIFDEVYTALDQTVKVKVSTYLKSLENVTKIFITHEQDILHSVDRVIFLSKGKLVCSGNHSSLICNNLQYKEFWKYKELIQNKENI